MSTYWTVSDQSAGASFQCAENESLLAGMRRTGTYLASKGCFGGGCGVCKIRIINGQYHIFKRMSSAHVPPGAEAEGVVLSCCVKPRSDLTVERA